VNRKIIGSLLGSLLVIILCVSGAAAQAQRTFVSGLGSDGNPCSRTAPCRTFAQAITQTIPRGEVVVLDSAGYAPFTITQSVSVVAPPGVYAGISVFTTDGIDITGGPDVVLRGLTITNQGGGLSGNGIVFNTTGELHMENCVVQGFQSGNVALNFTGSGSLVVKDSIIRNNSHAIVVQPSGTAIATIDHVLIEGTAGGYGVQANDGSQVTVRNTVSSGSVGGFVAQSAGTAAVELNIDNCTAANNGHGIVASSDSMPFPATVRVSNSTITDNTTGIQTFGATGAVLSRGNNTVEGNGTNTSGTIGSYTAK
jgi:hypothetical protein